MYEIFPGKVIISEDLQKDPESLFKECLKYCDFEFKKEMLTYDPLYKVGIPKNFELFLHWFERCVNSTTLESGVTDIDSIEIKDEKV